jgi:hypothetical protein
MEFPDLVWGKRHTENSFLIVEKCSGASGLVDRDAVAETRPSGACFAEEERACGKPLSPDEVRELHREARRERVKRMAASSAIERMEEAYRLFRLIADCEEAGR